MIKRHEHLQGPLELAYDQDIERLIHGALLDEDATEFLYDLGTFVGIIDAAEQHPQLLLGTLALSFFCHSRC